MNYSDGLNVITTVLIRGRQRRFDTNRRGRSKATTEAKFEPIRGQYLVKGINRPIFWVSDHPSKAAFFGEN